jgi:hypothetical protein
LTSDTPTDKFTSPNHSMLCRNSYSKDYIGECRSRMEAQLAAYRKLVTAAGEKESAINAFEPLFFNNLVVALEGCFVHRSRTLEKKDGNPLNEVRMLADSILQHHGVLSADNTIKYDPARSVLKLKLGDEINLTESDFIALFRTFFSEIEAKFA